MRNDKKDPCCTCKMQRKQEKKKDFLLLLNMEFRLNEPHPVFFGLFLQECYWGNFGISIFQK